ncbi:MAG: hypothetical protein JWL72_2191 [Ilumatobacteraceae bacterium]|nr:hypothetical protein [Ilumatobacteraceae bacterium]
MSSIGGVVRAGVRRRRVQTVMTAVAAVVAVTAAVLGLTLLHESTAPFDRAFARQHGSHLTAQFDATQVTAAQLTATATLPGVIASAGPFPTVTVTPSIIRGEQDPHGPPGRATLSPITVVGRSRPDTTVDDLTLLTGRWVSAPGEIVVATDADLPSEIGTKLTLDDLPGAPVLTVVGTARSVSLTADAWMLPAEVEALSQHVVTSMQMLYRFAHAATSGDMSANRASLAAAVGGDALTGSHSWLDVQQGTDRNTALFIPFLVAFGTLGVIMSVLVVVTVVTGAVGSGRHRIGILKALGFTPGQVVRAYVAQALVPTAIGIAAGLVAGSLLSGPILHSTDQLYGTTTSGVDPKVDALVAVGALAVVALSALAAAWQAGRLRVLDALAGRAPHADRGHRAAWLAGRLPLPRSVSLGLAQPFARPTRSSSMVLAVVFGTAAVTFAIGLGTSLNAVQAAKDHDNADVSVDTFGSLPGPHGIGPDGSPPPSIDAAGITSIVAAIDAQEGTARSFSISSTDATIPALAGTTTVFAFNGDASWSGYAMVSGRWFTSAGEAVVPTTFLHATNTSIGDTISLFFEGRAVPIRIVGEVFDPHEQTMEVLTDASTIATAAPDLLPDHFSIEVRPGTDISAYITRLGAQLQPLGLEAIPTGGNHGGSDTIAALDALTAALTLLLIVVSALGVLSAVVLDTRDRAHDLGIHRSLGMTPRQTRTMVFSSVTIIGLIGGLAGTPLGILVHRIVLPAMGHSAGVGLPRSVLSVYRAPELVALIGEGLLIALLGAALPAAWASRARSVDVLRAE